MARDRRGAARRIAQSMCLPLHSSAPHGAVTSSTSIKKAIARFTAATGAIDTSTTAVTGSITGWRSAMTNGTAYWGGGNGGLAYMGFLGSSTGVAVTSTTMRGSAVFSDPVLGTSLWVASGTQVRRYHLHMRQWVSRVWITFQRGACVASVVRAAIDTHLVLIPCRSTFSRMGLGAQVPRR